MFKDIYRLLYSIAYITLLLTAFDLHLNISNPCTFVKIPTLLPKINTHQHYMYSVFLKVDFSSV